MEEYESDTKKENHRGFCIKEEPLHGSEDHQINERIIDESKINTKGEKHQELWINKEPLNDLKDIELNESILVKDSIISSKDGTKNIYQRCYIKEEELSCEEDEDEGGSPQVDGGSTSFVTDLTRGVTDLDNDSYHSERDETKENLLRVNNRFGNHFLAGCINPEELQCMNDGQSEILQSGINNPPITNAKCPTDLQYSQMDNKKMENHEEKPTRSKHKCCFLHCSKSKNKFPELHFFSFPVSRPNICKEWVINCANDALKDIPDKTLNRRVVCEKHFTEDSFTSTMKTNLRKTAIPTLVATDDEVNICKESNINKQHELNVNIIKCCSCLLSMPKSPLLHKKYKKSTPVSKVLTTTKKRLLMTIQRARTLKRKYLQAVKQPSIRKLKLSKEDLITSMQEYLPGNIFKLFVMQLNHSNNSNNIWNEEEKHQLLSMRFKSPTLFNQMRSEGFALPSPSTIAQWLQEAKFSPESRMDNFAENHS